jgi:hypothetical protein
LTSAWSRPERARAERWTWHAGTCVIQTPPIAAQPTRYPAKERRHATPTHRPLVAALVIRLLTALLHAASLPSAAQQAPKGASRLNWLEDAEARYL